MALIPMLADSSCVEQTDYFPEIVDPQIHGILHQVCMIRKTIALLLLIFSEISGSEEKSKHGQELPWS